MLYMTQVRRGERPSHMLPPSAVCVVFEEGPTAPSGTLVSDHLHSHMWFGLLEVLEHHVVRIHLLFFCFKLSDACMETQARS